MSDRARTALAVDVDVTVRGEYCEAIFELGNGRILVTSNAGGGWAALFPSRAGWAAANSEFDALEVYDSVAEAFAALA